jgi:transposase
VINSIRAHLAEFGIVAPVGRKGVTELLRIVADSSDKRVAWAMMAKGERYKQPVALAT